jgi:hypothetical protein
MVRDLLLLSKDTPIAKIINENLEPLRPKRLPLYLACGGNL